MNLRYEGSFKWGQLDARGYYQDTRHEMNILGDKIPGMNMPMDTKGANLGYAVQAEIPLSGRDTLRIGNEFRRFTLDDWWPPVTQTVGSMGPNTLWNVSDGRRDRFGTYVEWESHRGRGWTELIGVRGELVQMNTGNVQGYNSSTTTTGSAAYAADAAEFNSVDHARQDINFDLTALARYEPRATRMFEFGYARKTRSPSIYERYLWVKRSAMSVQMNGWFGDANGYTGNLNLRPEVANTFSATTGWHSTAEDGWQLKITPYYTRVQDYVDVDRCPVINDGSNGCTAARYVATSGFVTLQFANHAALLYGVDASWRAPLGGNAGVGRFALVGLLGYVRGENLDSGGNLYQMMPVYGQAGLEHRRGNWSSAFEFRAVDAKTRRAGGPERTSHSGLRAAQRAHFVPVEACRMGRSPDRCRHRQPHRKELRHAAGRALLDRRQDGKNSSSRHGAIVVCRPYLRILIGGHGILGSEQLGRYSDADMRNGTARPFPRRPAIGRRTRSQPGATLDRPITRRGSGRPDSAYTAFTVRL